MKSPQTPFVRDGYLGPVRVLKPSECRAVKKHFENGKRPPPADWHKGGAVTDWLLYRLAASPRLLKLVTPILGEDIVLWGCSMVRRRPGQGHPWHVDIETSRPNGRYVSVWIGLENTSRESGLQLLAGSHFSDKTIQQVQAEKGYHRGDASTETVLAWAQERNPDAHLVKPALGDGEAVLFDGRLWHGSHNIRAGGTRSALLLQFAAADSPVRMYDLNRLEWPFHFLSAPLPPTVVVQGAATGDVNRLVPPPARFDEKSMPMLSSCIRSLDLPLAEHPDGGWLPHPLFKGSTRIVDEMTCHAAVLSAGHSPHPPHAHKFEELLIVLDGEAELLIADGPTAEGARVERVGPGAFSYYPAQQHHTIRNPGSSPVTYMMFKWHVATAEAAENPLGASVFRYDSPEADGAKGFVTRTVFQQPTGLLGRLHCHTTFLAPGAGYEAHIDAYDVAMIMLSGRVETLGQEVGPNSVIFYSAGERHGMQNIGDEPARYLVFEFHAPGVELRKPARRHLRPRVKRLLRRAASALGVRSASRR
jgi:mannose-6-phosphate isomerase-like protein (cupin superfamily)